MTMNLNSGQPKASPSLVAIAQSLEQFFGPEGTMVKNSNGKSNYRWSQLEMALSMNKAYHTKQNMLVEAPTGTGKTLAYLIPVALYLRENPNQRFVISVSTKHLQSQIENDMEHMSEHFPELKKGTVLKGAANYLCLTRLRKAQRRNNYNKQVQDELDDLVKNHFPKLEKLAHGWREELPIKVSDQTWALMNSDGTCCPSMLGCYRKLAKKQAMDARIIVVNSDLMGYNVKYLGVPVPTHPKDTEKPILIVDEAHTFLGRLTDVESADLSIKALENALNQLTKDSHGKHDLSMKVMKLNNDLETVKSAIMLDAPTPQPGSFTDQVVVNPADPVGISCNNLVKIIREMSSLATTQKNSASSEEMRQEYMEIESKLQFSGSTLGGYLDGKMANYVMMLNRTTTTQGGTHLNLELKPFELTDALDKIWSKFKQISLVSATLIGTSIPETKRCFNAATWECNNYPSPFQYNQQMRVFLPPKREKRDDIAGIIQTIKDVTKSTDGRVLVLFTSYDSINAVSQGISQWSADNDYRLYVQERNVAPDKICGQFADHPKAIILGNQSMGTGVDMRGIRAVIIPKLPFDQFSPYQDAKNKFLEKKGINPFTEMVLADTVRRFKQWIGRLVRREGQKGLIVLLDNRINTAFYGQEFIKALPRDVKKTHLDDALHPLPTHAKFMEWHDAGLKASKKEVEVEPVID